MPRREQVRRFADTEEVRPAAIHPVIGPETSQRRPGRIISRIVEPHRHGGARRRAQAGVHYPVEDHRARLARPDVAHVHDLVAATGDEEQVIVGHQVQPDGGRRVAASIVVVESVSDLPPIPHRRELNCVENRRQATVGEESMHRTVRVGGEGELQIGVGIAGGGGRQAAVGTLPGSQARPLIAMSEDESFPRGGQWQDTEGARTVDGIGGRHSGP